MYAKIQKDNSENYILIQAQNIELSYTKVPTSFKNYCQDFLIYLLDNDTSCISKYVTDGLMFIFRDVPTNTIPATCMSIYDCKSYWETIDAVDFSCSIKGIKIDDTYYVTCGNIYIMNDSGQTIQRI